MRSAIRPARRRAVCGYNPTFLSSAPGAGKTLQCHRGSHAPTYIVVAKTKWVDRAGRTLWFLVYHLFSLVQRRPNRQHAARDCAASHSE